MGLGGLSDFVGRREGIFLNTPFVVVKVHEGLHGLANIIDGSENPAIDGLLFQSAVEAFGNLPLALL